ncbi:MAG: hypothetical protein FD137_745 [Spirochaetes bacterium]|nr:MAG: hypothetical protein FD137_745 [Spirochaetota bacterium]
MSGAKSSPREMRKFFLDRQKEDEKLDDIYSGTMIIDPPPPYLPFQTRASKAILRQLIKHSKDRQKMYFEHLLNEISRNQSDD